MAVPEHRIRTRGNRRELILQAARAVFLNKGYNGAAMDEIAQAAGLSVGTVYLYFRNKPALYLSLLESALENQEKALKRAALRGKTVTEKLLKMAEAYADYFLKEPEYFQALIFLQHGDLRIPDSAALARKLADRGAALLRFVARLIEAGIERGEFRRMEAYNTALFLWGAWNGVIGLTLRRDPLRLDRKHLKDLVRFGASLIEHGLRAAERP